MVKTNKFRWFAIQRNYDFETHDKDKNVTWNVTEDEWRNAMIKFFRENVDSGVFELATVVFHDKDEIDTGFKPIHLHAIVKLKSPSVKGHIKVDDTGTIIKRTGAVNILGASKEENLAVLETAGERGAMAMYDLHITQKAISENKHIYSEDDVILMGNISNYHELLKLAKGGNKLKDADAFAVSLRTKIWKGEMIADDALDVIFKEYGDEDPILAQQLYDKNKDYYTANEDLFGSRLAHEASKSRVLTPIYVSGSGGSGKTTLSVAIGRLIDDVREPYVTPAPAEGVTYDLADGYHYEKVAVVDDLDPTKFSPLSFTGLFDNGQYRMSAARNKNKHFLPNVAFISIERDMERYISEMMIYSKGGSRYSVQWQGKRWDRHPALNDEVSTVDMYHQVERRIAYTILINGSATANNLTINVFKFIAKTKDDTERYQLIAKNIPFTTPNYKKVSLTEKVMIDDDDKKVFDAAALRIYKVIFEDSSNPDLGRYEKVYRDMKL